MAGPDFTAVFHAEFDFVVASLRRLGVQDRDVQDVAQDVFVSVHKHFASFDAARRLRPWLFGFTRRAASNYRRLARHAEQSSEHEGAQLTPRQTSDRHESSDLVHRALLAMPEKRRVVLMMADLYQFEASEIAEQLNVPLGTVYSRVRRAREEFRALARKGMQTKTVPRKGDLG